MSARVNLCARVSVCMHVPDLLWETDVEATSHFSQTKYVSVCQSGADGSHWSSPEAKAVLVIWFGPPLVMEADPRLERQSINIDCDEQDN